MQFSHEFGGAGLDPALLVPRRRALLEHVNRARQAAGFVRCRGKGDFLREVAGGDRLHRCVEGPDWFDDPPRCEVAEQAGQEDPQDVDDQDLPSGLVDGLDRLLPGKVRLIFVVLYPFARNLA